MRIALAMRLHQPPYVIDEMDADDADLLVAYAQYEAEQLEQRPQGQTQPGTHTKVTRFVKREP